MTYIIEIFTNFQACIIKEYSTLYLFMVFPCFRQDRIVVCLSQLPWLKMEVKGSPQFSNIRITHTHCLDNQGPFSLLKIWYNANHLILYLDRTRAGTRGRKHWQCCWVVHQASTNTYRKFGYKPTLEKRVQRWIQHLYTWAFLFLLFYSISMIISLVLHQLDLKCFIQ